MPVFDLNIISLLYELDFLDVMLIEKYYILVRETYFVRTHTVLHFIYAFQLY